MRGNKFIQEESGLAFIVRVKALVSFSSVDEDLMIITFTMWL